MNDLDLVKVRAALQETMLAALPQTHPQPDLNHFYSLLRDYPERGGKHLRGQLVLLSSEAHGLPWREALRLAAALELFQCWVLIHDDIEDDSEERRGQPALHRATGVPIAINVGDALHVYMWELLHGLDTPHAADIYAEFTRMIHRTAEGQHLDLSWVGQGRFDISEADYLQMVRLKTAYYTVVSPLRLGALIAGHRPDVRFEEAGCALGVAFQIRDDVLNLMPDVAYGKEFAGDLYEAKRTLILAHLFAHLNGADTKVVQSRLAKPRGEKTPEDIELVLAYVSRVGSLEYAQSVADEHLERGLAALAAALQSLPNQLAVRKLTGLLEPLTRRRR